METLSLTNKMDTGRKDDGEKAPLALIPTHAEYLEALAFADGMRKYGQWNYLKGMQAIRLMSGVRRHMNLWLAGEECASDSGVHHLGHARAGLGMIIQLQHTGKLVDDRYRGELK